MVAANKGVCAICREKKERLFSIDENVVEKRLSEVIENISGVQVQTLNSPREFLICVDCAVALIQTENVVKKLRRALATNASALIEAQGRDPKRKKLLPEDASEGEETGAPDLETPKKSKQDAVLQTTFSSKSTWLFKCDQCPYETEIAKFFKKHRLTKHQLDNPRIYQCMFCSESYQRQNGIHNHIAYVHEHKPRSTRPRRKSVALDVPINNGVDLQMGTDASMAHSQESDDCTMPQKAKLHKSVSVPISSEALTTYRFECSQCQYETENAKFFKKHLLTKHKIEKPRIYKCTQCTSSYKLLYALRNHVAFVHEQKPRPIPQRRKSVAPGFVNDEPLLDSAQHESPDEERLSQDEDELTTTCLEFPRPQNCDYCSYSAGTAKHLRKHISSKHCFDTTEKEEMDVSSDVLEEKLKIKEEYIAMPSINHSQEENFAMGVQLQAKSKADWIFICGRCRFETNKKKQYKSHLLTAHKIDDECIYKCTYCSVSFERYSLLQNHIETAHQNTDPERLDDSQLNETEEEHSMIFCRFPNCNKRFSKASKLRQHLMKKHTILVNSENEEYST